MTNYTTKFKLYERTWDGINTTRLVFIGEYGSILRAEHEQTTRKEHNKCNFIDYPLNEITYFNGCEVCSKRLSK